MKAGLDSITLLLGNSLVVLVGLDLAKLQKPFPTTSVQVMTFLALIFQQYGLDSVKN